MNETRYAWPNRDLEGAYTLPSRYFYDPAIFEAEKHAIFYRAWHVAGHLGEVAEPGKFIKVDIFEQSVIVVRGRDGVLRAFHNVCMHRGNRLVTEPRGHVKAFKCAYHAWLYGLDGALRGAPRTEQMAGFDGRNVGLSPVRVQEFAGFAYVNLDKDAEDMEVLFPGAEAFLMDLCPDMADMVLDSEEEVIIPANWKVIVDNAIESYHVMLSGPCHKELADFLDFKMDLPICRGNWWTLGGPIKEGLNEMFGVPLNDEPYQTETYMNWWLFPATCLYTVPYTDLVSTFLIIPTGPEETRVTFQYYSPQRPETKITAACKEWMNGSLGPEDVELNITVQQGLKSFGYDQGRYMIDAERSSESEHAVYHFHTLVHDALMRHG
ncbi:MAG: aromatic ring-hydroxylating dioxygenase subunit alpha [Pseudomonadota bacterium]